MTDQQSEQSMMDEEFELAESEDSFDTQVPLRVPTRSTKAVVPNTTELPILKGQYDYNNGSPTWIGVWGMGSEGSILGTSSEFRYKYSNKNPPLEDIPPNDRIPLSGFYTGYFLVKIDIPKRVQEQDVELTFTSNGTTYVVEGSGINEYGSFVVHGCYNPETKDLTCLREYVQDTTSVKSVKRPKKKSSKKSSVGPAVKKELSVKKEKEAVINMSEEMKMCYTILQKLLNHHYATPFLHPVDPIRLGIPDYLEVVKCPMDLSTIKRKMKHGEITRRDDFIQHVRLVFDNALLYNSSYSDIAMMANTLNSVFERELAGVSVAIFSTEEKKPFYREENRRRQIQVHRENSVRYVNMRSRVSKEMSTMLKRMRVEDDKKSKRSICENEIQLFGHRVELPSIEARVLDEEEIEALAKQIKEADGDDLRCILTILLDHIPKSEGTNERMTIQLSSVSMERLRKLQLFFQEKREASFLQEKEKAEMNRKKAVTERLLSEVKKRIADSTSSSEDD